MPHLEPADRADLSAYEHIFQAVESTMGFLPRSMLTMGHNPPLLEAFGNLGGVILGSGSIDPGLKQLVAHVSSTASGCRYCQAHTASTAARRGVSSDKIEEVWLFETSDKFTPAETAALRLARDASIVPNATTKHHFDDLAEHFNPADILELVSVISLFGWLNRWNDTLGTELEDEPLSFASEHLVARGWDPGKHQHPESVDADHLNDESV